MAMSVPRILCARPVLHVFLLKVESLLACGYCKKGIWRVHQHELHYDISPLPDDSWAVGHSLTMSPFYIRTKSHGGRFPHAMLVISA